jgi:hypothetical protein
MRALDQIQDMSLLLIPGRATPAVHNAMLRYCEVERDGTAFAILDPPAGTSATEIVAYVEVTAALLNLSEYGLQFARHKNNTEGLRATVRRTITSFLLTQMNNGAFRTREPKSAFFVDVSDQLNTPTVIFAGKLIARVGLATNKPAEFIVLRISQDTRALEAELAAAGA